MKRRRNVASRTLLLQLIFLVVFLIAGLLLVPWKVAICGDAAGLRLNLGTELLGAAATYGLFTLVLGSWLRREAAKLEAEKLKQELIQNMGSKVQDVAVTAAEELRAQGWLTDGSLEGAYLFGANLQGMELVRINLRRANLGLANLQGVDLGFANLQEANLFRANLQEADLRGGDLQEAFLIEANLQEAKLGPANLQGAILMETNLQGAGLVGVNLQRANLVGADLKEARLWEAALQGANLEEANLQWALLRDPMTDEVDIFDGETTLPDGTKWTPDTDLARFTDPAHPDFWRSDNPNSPAYRGRNEGAPEA